ncbi:MAG: DegT/DnrJ/EryC1/StrS family aminotransferase [Tannerellaceae bacterium]|jgi:dTDP-4-amino-4,6-dideoxygalactose transaminase|nr:DegT/DnrJ/EryC1/StrS family aminotransferase [Tannerellaceae bacterium]
MADGKIQMVNLAAQHHRLQSEIDDALREVMAGGLYINGPQVAQFAEHLASYLGVPHLIPCGNGTDALQIALMRLNLQRGDEVILPAFTYAAAVEAAILLGLTPVLADVDRRTFNLSPEAIPGALSSRTRVILPVHLFGQSCSMQPILEIARRHKLTVIEDNAQSLGAEYIFPDGSRKKAGAMGAVGVLSFFPTKILGGYGDGGALAVHEASLAEEIRITTLHGQSEKYHHRLIGCNSRLDTLQAALLDVKLRHLDAFIAARRRAAAFYDAALQDLGDHFVLPYRHPCSPHVFHQYTLQVNSGKRDALQQWLRDHGIPSAVYYPLVVDEQPAFRPYIRLGGDLPVARRLTQTVLSLPMHTELTFSQLARITQSIADFFHS